MNNLKFYKIKSGIAVYSGLYILGKINYLKIKSILYSDDFINYIRMLGKYKNGGYYTFSSGDLKRYLVYKLNNG